MIKLNQLTNKVYVGKTPVFQGIFVLVACCDSSNKSPDNTTVLSGNIGEMFSEFIKNNSVITMLAGTVFIVAGSYYVYSRFFSFSMPEPTISIVTKSETLRVPESSSKVVSDIVSMPLDLPMSAINVASNVKEAPLESSPHILKGLDIDTLILRELLNVKKRAETQQLVVDSTSTSSIVPSSTTIVDNTSFILPSSTTIVDNTSSILPSSTTVVLQQPPQLVSPSSSESSTGSQDQFFDAISTTSNERLPVVIPSSPHSSTGSQEEFFDPIPPEDISNNGGEE